MKRERLDKVLVDRGEVASREQARGFIMTGAVRVDGQVVDKPGTSVSPDATIAIERPATVFVSRGGVKLDAALDHFSIDLHEAIVLDVGASSGGFTDCVLRRGAQRVIAIDVGYGQFAWVLRTDPRVVLLERTNIRHVRPGDLSLQPTHAVIDVSFISLTLVLAPIVGLLAPAAITVALVKPQFEVGKGRVGKGGVVREPALHAESVAKVRTCGESLGLVCLGEHESPILGPKGNREFFLSFRSPG